MKLDKKLIQTFRSKLRVLEREIIRQMRDETVCCGVTLAQCHILLEIESKESISIKELTEVLELDKSTLSRTVDNMVETGFLDRNIHPDDRRYMRIMLTEKGRETAKYINKMCDEYYLELFKNIPASKHEEVICSIHLVADSMSILRKKSSCGLKKFCGSKGDKK